LHSSMRPLTFHMVAAELAGKTVEAMPDWWRRIDEDPAWRSYSECAPFTPGAPLTAPAAEMPSLHFHTLELNRSLGMLGAVKRAVATQEMPRCILAHVLVALCFVALCFVVSPWVMPAEAHVWWGMRYVPWTPTLFCLRLTGHEVVVLYAGTAWP